MCKVRMTLEIISNKQGSENRTLNGDDCVGETNVCPGIKRR